ncbi:MAG TPA: trypsin-like peptidase domain-containing protein [Streptosporangiaceae bacterium]|nr:trypsin-like peptidase domain-containing protein [Streptosporangiaceae bacterium]
MRRRRAVPAGALLAAATAVTAALAACSGSGSGSASTAAASTSTASGAVPSAAASASAAALQQTFVSVIKRMLPSVVEIQTSSGLGSGVVFDSAGDIVTNAHVVGSATKFEVVVSSSASPRPATLVGKYAPDDLAVIKVSNAGQLHPALRPAVFGNSARLEVGDIVLAIGTPLGLASSATEGIVSAVGRTVSEPSQQGAAGATLPDTIQTSAAINPGNSGGALVNLAGQVVGIPTLAATDQQLGGAAPGIGFAISSNTAVLIARQLVASGTVTNSGRAALGVNVSSVAGTDGAPSGCGVASVTKGGPAARAGIVAGDTITAINGQATPDTQALAATLATLHPGQVARVSVSRADGSEETVRVTLGQLPGS